MAQRKKKERSQKEKPPDFKWWNARLNTLLAVVEDGKKQLLSQEGGRGMT
jgi:hypothetical protein